MINSLIYIIFYSFIETYKSLKQKNLAKKASKESEVNILQVKRTAGFSRCHLLDAQQLIYKSENFRKLT